jgi:prepilin-type N-terminal cleavage/methylation domain-containing protein
MWQKQKGFTIVELLIVIVVIGILAAISVIAYVGVTQRSKESRAKTELAQLHKAINTARVNRGVRLNAITGSNCTVCYGNGAYHTALDNIAAASGTNLDSYKNGDPWGNDYRIDENEGEGANPCANRDTLSVSGQAGVPVIYIPFYSC